MIRIVILYPIILTSMALFALWKISVALGELQKREKDAPRLLSSVAVKRTLGWHAPARTSQMAFQFVASPIANLKHSNRQKEK